VTALAAAIILAAIATPHALRLDRTSPALAATVWMSALALRALTAIFTALFVLLYLPGSKLFQLVSHLCWHTVLPFLATHLGLSGHDLGDVALVPELRARRVGALGARGRLAGRAPRAPGAQSPAHRQGPG
jgi:hypothetical protein